MKIYIAGPISGKPLFNEKAFRKAETRLKDLGYETVVPHDVIPYRPELEQSDYMRACLAALAKCDGIYMLYGWEQSKGAKMEKEMAAWLNISVLFPENSDSYIRIVMEHTREFLT